MIEISKPEAPETAETKLSDIDASRPMLTVEILAVHTGTGDPHRLLDAVRAAVLYGQIGPTAAPSMMVTRTDTQGCWLCLYSSLDLMARTVGRCRYIAAPGADILDVLLPALASTTQVNGIFVDLGTRHALALPAIPSLVAAGISFGASGPMALDLPGPTEPGVGT